MYINASQYGHAFSEIKRTSSSHSTCKLIVFVSCLSIDSICTAKILSLVFKKSLVQYQLIPVVGYADMKAHYARLDADVANVVLVGCGAMVDLETFFEIDPADFVVASEDGPAYGSFGDDLDFEHRQQGPSFRRKIYVIDGSRPWNLDNVFGSEMVVCFDDGYIDQHMTREKACYQQLVDASDNESDTDADSNSDSNSDESGDEENEENEEKEESKKRKSTTGGENGDEAGSESSGDENGPRDPERKRRLEQHSAKKLRKKRRNELRAAEDTLEAYYAQGTAVFTATTATVYALFATVGETSLEVLWLAIIGLSALDRAHPEVYDKIQPLYKEEVHRLSPSNSGTSSERTADSTTLAIDTDYHLFLLRHWTLYDAFVHSPLVNAKMSVWREDGRKTLHKMFARMGVSLAAAQQKWLYMDIGVKKELPAMFRKYLPQYGLDGVVREGFARTFGYMGQLSAMECVEALTALLEHDERANGGSGGRQAEPATDADEISSKIEAKEKLWVVNFWSSWDALNMTSHGKNSRLVTSNLTTAAGTLRKLKGFDLLVHGLEAAKHMQQVIFRTGTSVLERGLTKNLKIYRLCVLNDGAIPELHLFTNPLILAKLGNWLLESINEAELANFLAKKEDTVRSNILKPLVVASLDQASDTYLVIGLAPKYPRGTDASTKIRIARQDASLTTRLNTFSVAFQKVAATSGAKVRINSFDSSIIEIRKDDLSPFLEKLTLSGLI